MKASQRFGWIMLGCCPFIAVLFWQITVSSVSLYGYLIKEMLKMGSIGYEEQLRLMNQMIAKYQMSSVYNLTMFIIYVGCVVIFGLWYWLMYCRKRQTDDWKQILKPHRILAILLCGVCLQIAISMFLTVLLPLFPKIYESYMELMETVKGDSVWMILAVCLLAPIGEELIFRGLTFRTLNKAMPWWLACIIQAVLFGVYHLNLVQGVYATLLGLILGYLAYRYGSVISSILLHIAVNASSYLLSLLMSDIPETFGMLVGIGLIATCAGIACVVWATDKVTATNPASIQMKSNPAN